MQVTPPDWLMSIFRSVFPELAAMPDSELSLRVARFEHERDDADCLLHEQMKGRMRPQAGSDDVPFWE
jgi:hypothetical protein